jgi:ABC-type dipeptide/oligopeptide/nickel transport system ATPase component
MLFITHRLAGLESVEEIMVMDAGQVVERGTHDTLLAEGGRYSSLWWEEMSTSRYAGEDANGGEPMPSRQPEPTAPLPLGGSNDGSPER